MRILWLLCTLFLASCTIYSPSIDYDRKASFTDLTRYAWAPEQQASPEYRTLDQGRIRRALDAALAARNMTETSADQAQVWVDFRYGINRRYEQRANFYGYYGWYPYWWGMQPDYRLEERDESRLTVMLVNPVSRAVIWTGETVLRYYHEQPPEQRDASLRAQVESILQHFPPR